MDTGTLADQLELVLHRDIWLWPAACGTCSMHSGVTPANVLEKFDDGSS